MGGITEFMGSLVKEIFLGIRLWDYSHQPFNIFGRTSLLYSFLWGLLGILFIKVIYPFLTKLIGKLGLIQKKNFTRLFLLAFILNLIVTGFALQRWNDRQAGEAPANTLEEKIDQHFPDQVLEKIYPSLEQSN